MLCLWVLQSDWVIVFVRIKRCEQCEKNVLDINYFEVSWFRVLGWYGLSCALIVPISYTVWVKIKYPKVSDFFSGKSGKVILKYYKSFKSMVHWPPGEFWIFSIRFRHSISASILLKYPNFIFVNDSVDLVIKVQISKSVVTMACATHTSRL